MGLSIETIGNIGAGAIGGGLQMLTQKDREKRAVKNQMQLNQQSKDLALQMWKDTNYSAQVEEMKKAGLNVGLMYGQGGGGGTTSNTGSGGSAPSPQPLPFDIGEMAQIALLKAQKENIEADTENKKAGAEYTTGAQTKATEAEIKQTEASTGLTEEQTRLAELTNKQMAGTLESNIESAKQTILLNEKEIERKGLENKLNKETIQSQIQQAKLQVTETTLKNELLKAQKNNTVQLTQESKARIDQKWQEIIQGWENLNINAKKNRIEEFNAEIKAMYPTVGQGVGKIMNDLMLFLNQGQEPDKKTVEGNNPQW